MAFKENTLTGLEFCVLLRILKNKENTVSFRLSHDGICNLVTMVELFVVGFSFTNHCGTTSHYKAKLLQWKPWKKMVLEAKVTLNDFANKTKVFGGIFAPVES